MPFPFDNVQTIGILSNATAPIGGPTLPFVPKQEKQWGITDGIAQPSFVMRLWKPAWPEITILGGGLGSGIQDYSYHTYDYVSPYGSGGYGGYNGSIRWGGHGGGGGTGTYPPGDDQAERKSFKGKYFKDVVIDVTHSDPNDPCNEKNRANFRPNEEAQGDMDFIFDTLRTVLQISRTDDSDSALQRILYLLGQLVTTITTLIVSGRPLLAGALAIVFMLIDLMKAGLTIFQEKSLEQMVDNAERISRLGYALQSGQFKKGVDTNGNFVFPCPEDQKVEDEIRRQMEILTATNDVLLTGFLDFPDTDNGGDPDYVRRLKPPVTVFP
ncbi:MAG TPA: hypothetical protein VIX80_05450 [Candidatus Kapabacteria bacterium]